jgi:hypothetical protein
VILGEFGGKYGEGDPRDVRWHNTLVDYLVGKGATSAFYWSWNPNSGDTGGILDDDWISVRDDKVALLRRLWAGTSGPSAPTVTLTANPTSITPPPAPPGGSCALAAWPGTASWRQGPRPSSASAPTVDSPISSGRYESLRHDALDVVRAEKHLTYRAGRIFVEELVRGFDWTVVAVTLVKATPSCES